MLQVACRLAITKQCEQADSGGRNDHSRKMAERFGGYRFVTLFQQIMWGSSFLAVCLLVQTACLALCVQAVPAATRRFMGIRKSLRFAVILLVSLAFIVISLTIQVWIWAFVYFYYDILPDWNSAVYFSLVTFTALGYGDIVVGPDVRVFASFGSVTGLLIFGINTAFLVSAMKFFGATADDQSNGEKSRAIGAP